MTKTAKPMKLKPFEDYDSLKDLDVLATGRAVEARIENPNFPNLPVDAKTLKAHNDDFEADLIASHDGSRQAKADKNKSRELLIKDLRLNGRYVQVVANGDPAVFNTSGFVPAAAGRTPRFSLSRN